ncbi:MAG: hypothetical protein PVJ67_05880 [Candidatus Pacearchaeota archaeon]|jgi:hypothetical protein
MAGKKSVKKKTAKKVARKKIVKKVSNKRVSKKAVRPTSKKLNIVVKNLILFAVLSLLSFMLYKVSSSEVYMNLFSILSMILFFIALAFFIVLLVFLLLRVMKKK